MAPRDVLPQRESRIHRRRYTSRAAAPARAWVGGCASPLPTCPTATSCPRSGSTGRPRSTAVEHLPVGFGAHHWVASVRGRPTYFVTLDSFGAHHDAESLEAAYAAASRLMFPLDFVVAPVPSTAGTLTTPFAGGALSVTPWVNGETPPSARPGDDVGVADPAARRATARRACPRWRTITRALTARRPRRARQRPVGLRSLRRAGPRRPARTARRGRRVVGGLPRPGRAGAAEALGRHPRRARTSATRSSSVGTTLLVDWESVRLAPAERDWRTLVDARPSRSGPGRGDARPVRPRVAARRDQPVRRVVRRSPHRHRQRPGRDRRAAPRADGAPFETSPDPGREPENLTTTVAVHQASRVDMQPNSCLTSTT